MKKILLVIFINISIAISTFASTPKQQKTRIKVTGVGVISDEDFLRVGVTQKNIDKVKLLVAEANKEYKRKIFARRKLEIEINEYMLDGTEKNLNKVNELIENIGVLDAEIIKNRLKYQIEVQKHITTEQYSKAREVAIQKIKEQQLKKFEQLKNN